MDWRRIRDSAVTVSVARGSAAGRGGSSSPGTLRRRSVVVLLLLVFFTGSSAALFAKGGYLELRELRQRRDAANRQLDRQLLNVHRMHRDVERLSHDSLARERLAREELGYARKGEIVFLLAEPRP